jgi:hypothetical protein
MMSKSVNNLLIIVLASVFLLWSISLSQAQVKPGDVIDSGNWQKAADFLPPAVVEMLKTHGLVIRVSESKEYPLHPKFEEATKKYAGFVKLENNLIDYKAGLPFPEINPKDPNAGVKIAWNYQYHSRPEQSHFRKFNFTSVNKSGRKERDAWGTYRELYYTGRFSVEPTPEIPNPEGVIVKQLLQMQDPQDVAGVGFLAQRYKSEKKDDDSWAYVPALRRVRRMSSAMRTDSYLGTDLAIEDFYGFSGKITEFDWKLIGSKKILGVRNSGFQPVLSGGTRYKWSPIDVPFELRDVWVVEARSLVKGHPYSKRRLYIDAQWFDGFFTEVFDRKGDLWKLWFQTWLWWPEYKRFTEPAVHMIDLQNLHATVCPCDVSMSKPFGPEMFILDRLEKLGY